MKVAGPRAPSVPNHFNASSEVVLFPVASPEVVLLPTSKSEAVRQVGFGMACPSEASGSFMLLPRPKVSSATAKILLEDAQILPLQQLLGLLTDLDKVHCQEISATRSKHGVKGSRELKNLDCSINFEGSSRGKGKRALSVF
jgi:hypothetical protein